MKFSIKDHLPIFTAISITIAIILYWKKEGMMVKSPNNVIPPCPKGQSLDWACPSGSTNQWNQSMKANECKKPAAHWYSTSSYPNPAPVCSAKASGFVNGNWVADPKNPYAPSPQIGFYTW